MLIQEDDANLKELRKRILLTAYSYQGGPAHLASAFSILEVLYALYMKKILKHDPMRPDWEDRDKLIMSKGHASLALYNILCMAGYFNQEKLSGFCKPNSPLGGEPNMRLMPGIEASTGSLGHGLSFGVGIAMANKMNHKETQVYIILGDGECQEGVIWEAVMSAANHKLNNLTVILDNNRIQKMGFVEDIMGIDSWQSRWESFGWSVSHVDGHNVSEICSSFTYDKCCTQPRILVADTVKGKGVSIMENNPDWHYKMPNKKELKIIIQELGITEMELAKCREPI